MNKLLNHLLAVALTLSTSAVYAATTPENTDDASNLGTSESSQVQKQTNRTDKGDFGVNQGATDSDASNLGNADTPQIKKQMENTNKGASEQVSPNNKNKVVRKKTQDHGTTKGNKVQPSEPEQAAPATNS